MIGRPPRRRRLDPPQSPARQYLGHRRRHRSREQDCSRQPSHRGFPATASTAHDPPQQRSASSIPPQNHQENLSSARVFTQPGSSAGMASMCWVGLLYPRIADKDVALPRSSASGGERFDGPGTSQLPHKAGAPVAADAGWWCACGRELTGACVGQDEPQAS